MNIPLRTCRSIVLVALGLLGTLSAGLSAAGDYSVDGWSVGGGGSSSGRDYSLSGSTGLHEAAALTGGNYTLAGRLLGQSGCGSALHPVPACHFPQRDGELTKRAG